jgi:hypothetical protein
MLQEVSDMARGIGKTYSYSQTVKAAHGEHANDVLSTARNVDWSHDWVKFQIVVIMRVPFFLCNTHMAQRPATPSVINQTMQPNDVKAFESQFREWVKSAHTLPMPDLVQDSVVMVEEIVRHPLTTSWIQS